MGSREHAHAGIKGWTFQVDGGDTCKSQTLFKAIAFTSSSSGSHTVAGNSSDDCCAHAVASGRSMWTFDKSARTCKLFYDATGRRASWRQEKYVLCGVSTTALR